MYKIQDEERVVSNTGALSLKKVPDHLVVIGGGYIGLELGCVWRRLGARVTVIEFLESIVPSMDREISRHLLKTLKQQGLDFRFQTKVTSVEKRPDDLLIAIEPSNGGATETLAADVVLVAVGRRPYTDGLGLDQVGVLLDPKGRIPVELGFKLSLIHI